ncbi:aspartic peptidase domain-containing protein [Fusarium acuminatum]|uniref:Aspartic peptidase domain-containing protein n=1 Tax=Fusarium acuminatum TaxID=5515 RepID=A0ABZ2WJZ6_9HYPO
MRQLLPLLLLASVACASPCDSEPLSLPIRDVQILPNVKKSLMTGIPAKIGSPEQSIVLLPWAELNNTWIYDDQPYCDKTVIWNDRICEIRRGGLYSEEDSKSFHEANDITNAGGATDEATFQGSEAGIKKLVSTSLAGTDNITLEGAPALADFPIGIPRLKWDAGYTLLHPLGLGSNSTYLNALRATGKISSRVWSIFWGRMWVKNPIEGSLVLGGYDEEKVIGKNYTAPLVYDDYTGTPGCWTGMKVTVSDIRVNFRDGSDESIFPSNTALPCCIVPQRQLLLEAPGAYVSSFEEVTGFNHTESSFGLHWSARLFDADKVFDGDITFHLDSGLQVRVPNDQYIVPFVDIDRSGARVTKSNVKELLMNGVADQPATLGRYFLTAAYLMVNHDAGTFTLWQANPSSKSKLVRVFDQDTADKCGEDASGIVQPTASATSTKEDETQPTEEAEAASSPSGAVIGGAVAGAVIGLGVAILGIFFLLRRRRNAMSTNQPPSPPTGIQMKDDKSSYPAWCQPQEMPGSKPMPSEMQGQSHYVYELDNNISAR